MFLVLEVKLNFYAYKTLLTMFIGLNYILYAFYFGLITNLPI
jgi:hypothetical protein